MSENPLDELYRDASPPPELEGRVMRTLRSAGLIESRKTMLGRRVLAAGVLAAALILGFVLGRTRVASADSAPRYLLLLYEDSTYRDDRPVTEIIAEYAAWADSLRSEGELEAGEKLGDARVDVLSSLATSARPLTQEGNATGFFVVRAPEPERARAIAESSPHVRYGGRIVVRPIESTGR